MPITNSAKKALRQNIKRKKRNTVYKDKMKKLIKELAVLIENKKTKEANLILPKIYQILDKSAKTGVIKKNTASRKKSRLARHVGNKNV